MNILRSLRLRLFDFRRDDRGAMEVEGILASTFLIWWYIASFQYFDAFKQKNINLKAAYTIADMLSRETGPANGDPTATPVNQAYINGLNTMFDYLTYSRKPTWIRVTSVYFDTTTNKYHVDWSAASGSGHQLMTTPILQNYKNRLPILPDGDSVILVETFMAYEPIFSIGINAQVYSTFITTSPRFSSCLPWNTNGCGNDTNNNWVNPDMTDLPPP
ncbi:MAG: hypothetical protein JSR87_12870 [Proteobacteria bacterium]|nr:hypothetical protein [Pseudomonadota bacterium]MBS0571741.1 hypothetical protein [Pseudomonadota bacterium]